MLRRFLIVSLLAILCVPFFVRADEPGEILVNFNFDEIEPGPIGPEGREFSIDVEEFPDDPLVIRISRRDDPLEISTTGVATWGSGSLSTFHPDPMAPNVFFLDRLPLPVEPGSGGDPAPPPIAPPRAASTIGAPFTKGVSASPSTCNTRDTTRPWCRPCAKEARCIQVNCWSRHPSTIRVYI